MRLREKCIVSTTDSGVGGIELLVRLGGRMMLWFISSPENNVKKHCMFFFCILCYVSNVSFYSVASEICAGLQN
jgi:hypothetical protein